MGQTKGNSAIQLMAMCKWCYVGGEKVRGEVGRKAVKLSVRSGNQIEANEGDSIEKQLQLPKDFNSHTP